MNSGMKKKTIINIILQIVNNYNNWGHPFLKYKGRRTKSIVRYLLGCPERKEERNNKRAD